MEPYELPFGGLFDLNRDGVMDPTEDALAFMVVNDLINKDNSDDDDD